MKIGIEYPLMLSLFMFSAGVSGFLFRRNVIVVFMCIELMLNAVNLAFITFANMHQNIEGQVMAMFVMAVAAAEAAVGLAFVIALFRNKETTIVSEINILKD